MWKSLIGLGRDVFNLNRRVEGHHRQLGELADSVRVLSANDSRLSEQMLRLELELQHTKEAHARELQQAKESFLRELQQTKDVLLNELSHLRQEQAREREHWQARQSADRENFRLQIETLVLRWQRELPPPTLPEKPDSE